MKANELAEQIYAKIQERKSSTSSILRDARLLGKLLHTTNFDWTDKELKGYILPTDQIPTYRNVSALESKTWITHLDTSIQKIYSEFIKSKKWISWILTQSVLELESYISAGLSFNSGTVLQTLGFRSGVKTPIYQYITIPPEKIKQLLDQIQDRVLEQIGDVIVQPIANVPSVAVFLAYAEKFKGVSDDFDSVSSFLETGEDFTRAARSCRPILTKIIKTLIPNKIPKDYVFTDGKGIENRGEKSKFKYYFEMKGDSLYHDKKKLLDLDSEFREVYDIASKADKNEVNVYEAKLCVDKLIHFLEQLNRYTDLIPIL